LRHEARQHGAQGLAREGQIHERDVCLRQRRFARVAMLKAHLVEAQLASRALPLLAQKRVAVDARAHRAVEQRRQQHRLAQAAAQVQEAVAGSQPRQLEGVDDLVVAARRVPDQLARQRRLVQRWVSDSEQLLDEVVALEQR
jgi:hypothetical protein